jgi:hypothetical protein
MRAWCCHTTTQFLTKQIPPNVAGDHPTMKVGFRFCRPNGQTRPLDERWGLLDSGASITAVPAYLIGLFGSQFPADLTGPTSVTLTGLHATQSVPAYFALLSVSAQVLQGPYCPLCGDRLIGRTCPGCLTKPPIGAFLIAAVQNLDFPLIGRDVAEKFLTVINPFAKGDGLKLSMLANGPSGRLISQCLNVLRGESLSP